LEGFPLTPAAAVPRSGDTMTLPSGDAGSAALEAAMGTLEAAGSAGHATSATSPSPPAPGSGTAGGKAARSATGFCTQKLGQHRWNRTGFCPAARRHPFSHVRAATLDRKEGSNC